jgi:hypothetical protein
VFLHFKSFTSLILIMLTGFLVVSAQETTAKKPEPTPTPAPATITTKEVAKVATADQVAESSIFVYAPGGRETLNQIRKTTIERGRTSFTKPDGSTENSTYRRWILRAPTLEKEKIRLDQDFPSTKYSLVYNGEKIFGIFQDREFLPRADASKGFENQIIHGPEALLRYKENESKLELVKRDKIMGVELYVVDVTDKLNRKTRFFISAKSFRIMMLEYEEGGVKYMRKFYNYNYAQGILVPFRTVLWANDKIAEETDTFTITFGQRVDEELFVAAS